MGPLFSSISGGEAFPLLASCHRNHGRRRAGCTCRRAGPHRAGGRWRSCGCPRGPCGSRGDPCSGCCRSRGSRSRRCGVRRCQGRCHCSAPAGHWGEFPEAIDTFGAPGEAACPALLRSSAPFAASALNCPSLAATGRRGRCRERKQQAAARRRGGRPAGPQQAVHGGPGGRRGPTRRQPCRGERLGAAGRAAKALGAALAPGPPPAGG